MLLFNVSNKKIFHTRQQNYEIKSKPPNHLNFFSLFFRLSTKLVESAGSHQHYYNNKNKNNTFTMFETLSLNGMPAGENMVFLPKFNIKTRKPKGEFFS